jgi:hypothetical protein
MYDMYPWDSAGQGDYPPSPLRSRRAPSAKTGPETAPARAVQVALDRRDNGGDAEAMAAPPPARDATRATTGPTRQ